MSGQRGDKTSRKSEQKQVEIARAPQCRKRTSRRSYFGTIQGEASDRRRGKIGMRFGLLNTVRRPSSKLGSS